MNTWASPLKAKKTGKPPPPPPTRDEAIKKIQKIFKKKKCVITAGVAKKILSVKFADSFTCGWVERWIETLISSNGYPPQLLSGAFYSLLRTYFSADKASEILAQIRRDYRHYFPTTDDPEAKAVPPPTEEQKSSDDDSSLIGIDGSPSNSEVYSIPDQQE